MNLFETTEWKMALTNIEQMHPRYLVDLVQNGELEKVLNSRVIAYARTLERLRQAMPEDQAQEIAQSEHLTPVNPNWQDEPRLTREERKALKAELKRIRQNGKDEG